ncbi:MAG: amidohydrolase family protein [Burkholderiales bacterium]|nr:amidohydrolase family protein [Burkholderiales bacterium]
MDLVLHNATTGESTSVDIGIDAGRIAAIAPRIDADCERLDVGGRLVAPGFVETHIHLDKSCILDRCNIERGTLDEAIAQVSQAKRAFTPDDVFARASRTLEKAIAQGTTRLRTHVEVDPVIGLKGLEGIERLTAAYRWAVDIEICVFPQEGLTNYPGTEELMREALARSARVVGAAPYTDADPHAQIDRVFRMARDFDADIDMHLDLGDSSAGMDTEYVCAMTEKHRYGGRVAIGHVTKMSFLPPDRFAALAKRLADAGVAVTVLPATDLFLMGRQQTHSQVRGVLAAHHLLHHGINCSLATNNVLNPFTPFGDASLLRMANLYANVCHVGTREGMRDSFDMITRRPAQLMRVPDHGLAEGCAADLVVLDCTTPEEAVAELATPLFAFKRGRRTFTREPARLHRP